MPLKTRIHGLLRGSERYFKTDMVYLARGGSWLLSSQITVAILSFILSVAYANFLSKDTFGVYKYVLSVGAIFLAFSLTGLGTALTQSVARGFDKTLQSAFWTQLKWSIGLPVVAIFGSLYYYVNDNYTLAISLLIIGAFSPLSQAAGLFLTFLNGKKDFKTKAIFDIGYNFFPFIVILGAVFVTNDPVILVLTYFASFTLSALFFFLRTKKKYPGNEPLDSQTLSYSKHLSIINVLGTIASSIDKVLVFHYLGAIQLAVYALALAPATQFSSLLKSISILSLPKLAESTPTVILKTLPSKVWKLFLVLILPTGLYILLAPFLYGLLFPQYLESIFYSQLYILTLLFFPQEIMRTALTAQKSKRALYMITTGGSILKIILFIVLLPLYGITGAIVTILLANIFTTILNYYYLRKM